MRESGLSKSVLFWRQGVHRSRKNTLGRVCGEGLVIQCTVDEMVVVVQPPAVDHPADFRQAQEQLLVQEFVTKLAVEQRVITFSPRATLCDELRFRVGLIESAADCFDRELRTWAYRYDTLVDDGWSAGCDGPQTGAAEHRSCSKS